LELYPILLRFFDKIHEAKSYLDEQQKVFSNKMKDARFLVKVLSSWNKLSEYFSDGETARSRLKLAKRLFNAEAHQDRTFSNTDLKSIEE
jgi:hypothetical protein